MKLSDLPVLAVSEVKGDSLRGTVSRWQWVGEHFIAFLYLGEGRFIEGRFGDVSEKTRSVKFTSPQLATTAIAPGAQVPYLDGYWGELAALALDPLLEWREAEFAPTDATIYPAEGGPAKTMVGGWDHAHCGICWATISEPVNPRHMVSSRGDHLCCGCFSQYVQKRSIGFIP